MSQLDRGKKIATLLFAGIVMAMSVAAISHAGECTFNIDCGIGGKCVGSVGNKYCTGK